MSTTLTLSDFLAEEAEIHQTFAAWWQFKMTQEPEYFPAEMAAGEWDEQLRSFDSAEALAEMPEAQPEPIGAGPAIVYGRRRDGSAWFSIGDPDKGPHFMADFDAPDWVFKALGATQEMPKTKEGWGKP